MQFLKLSFSELEWWAMEEFRRYVWLFWCWRVWSAALCNVAGAFLGLAAAVWGGQRGGHICIWGGEQNSGWHHAWLSKWCNLTPTICDVTVWIQLNYVILLPCNQLNDGLTLSGTYRMHSCTHMATVGVKGLTYKLKANAQHWCTRNVSKNTLAPLKTRDERFDWLIDWLIDWLAEFTTKLNGLFGVEVPSSLM